MTPEDLRAAVQAGIVTEAQAASLKALGDARQNKRAALPAEDEPFEFFRGFSEIFISLGLIILLAGLLAVIALLGGPGLMIFLPLITAGIAWWMARYFTLKRRMILPSMVLALTFGGAIFFAVVSILLYRGPTIPDRLTILAPFAIAALAMGLFYRQYRLPFSMFVLGAFVLGALYSLTGSVEMVGALLFGTIGGPLNGAFDLNESPAFASITLIFGIGAFVAGMWFDMKDPYRQGRHAATAFWLHLLAAPALVNTVALTLYNSGGTSGMAFLTMALLVIGILALIIDRRSFLTAAVAYIGLVLAWIIGETHGYQNWAYILIALGALITALGTWWVQLRARIMTLLPDFPGKDRLPPYSRPE